MFRHVKKLQLLFSHDLSRGWLSTILHLIDLQTVETLELNGPIIQQGHPQVMKEMGKLLRHTPNVSSLHICDDFYMRKSRITADQLCSIVPDHVKHLGVSIQGLEDIRKTLNRLPFLSSAFFHFDGKSSTNRRVEWLHEEQRCSLYQLNDFSLEVWLARDDEKQMKHV